MDIKWQVIDKDENFYCESKGDEFNSIPTENIKQICIRSNELGKIVFDKTLNILYLNESDNLIRFEVHTNDKTYILDKEILIDAIPMYYKQAHTDCILASGRTETAIESYFCGFDSKYLIEEHTFKLEALLSIDLINKKLGSLRINSSSEFNNYILSIWLKDVKLFDVEINNYNVCFDLNIMGE